MVYNKCTYIGKVMTIMGAYSMTLCKMTMNNILTVYKPAFVLVNFLQNSLHKVITNDLSDLNHV